MSRRRRGRKKRHQHARDDGPMISLAAHAFSQGRCRRVNGTRLRGHAHRHGLRGVRPRWPERLPGMRRCGGDGQSATGRIEEAL